jgi:hypothetical protein
MAKTGEKEAKQVTEEITLEKALKVVRAGVEAKLFVPTHFWVPVLEAYDSVQGRLDSFVKGAADMDTQIRTLNAEVGALKDRLSEALNQLADAAASTLTVSAVTEPDTNVEPGLEPAAQNQDSVEGTAGLAGGYEHG